MKIAILHHHFNRGGVTQVVQNHLHGLARMENPPNNIVLLHGGRADALPALPATSKNTTILNQTVAGLDYATSQPLAIEPLAQNIEQALNACDCSPQDTILHVHNHALGKTPSLPGALKQLAHRGYRQLLHLHDFAEDMRPANYRNVAITLDTPNPHDIGDYLYPQAPHLHYAVLNQRDHNILLQSGIESKRIHLLPNPVTATPTTSNSQLPSQTAALQDFTDAFPQARNKRLILYPVRGIRRKNLGELLLWAALAPPDTIFAVTLPAESSAELPTYQRWKELAQQKHLPVLFEVGRHPNLSFSGNVAAASALITTSAAEGFGLVFLETWLHQRPLIGRNLPEITRDFCQQGIDLHTLGDSLQIPTRWFASQRLQADLTRLINNLYRDYGVTPPPSINDQIAALLTAPTIDFALLPRGDQSETISRVAQDHTARQTVLELNGWLADSLQPHATVIDQTITANAQIVTQAFSLDAMSHKLMELYQSLLTQETSSPIDSLPQPEKILHSFLDPQRFCPIRIET